MAEAAKNICMERLMSRVVIRKEEKEGGGGGDGAAQQRRTEKIREVPREVEVGPLMALVLV